MKIIKRNSLIILLFLLFFITGFLRFYNLNWDHGGLFHPDERNIANAVAEIHFFTQLNPKFFAYGGFSLYLSKITGEILTLFTHDPQWVSNWANINLIGRFFSALFATVTLIPLFLLAKKLFNNQIALLSVFLYTFAVSSIQSAHFATTESLFTLSGVLICLSSLLLYEKGTYKQYLFSGVLLGISAATKTTEFLFIIFPISAYFFFLIKHKQKIAKHTIFLLLLISSSVITFVFSSPYTFLNWQAFQASMRYEIGVATGSLPVFYTYQFMNTLPYFFQIKNFFWQLGPVVAAGILGFIFIIVAAIKRKNAKLAIFLSFPFIYFLYEGFWYAKFVRYMTPLIPYAIIAASYFLFLIKKRYTLTGNFCIVVFSSLTVLWCLSFMSIYTTEQTRITASKWIYQNIPPKAGILEEHWNDILPISLSPNNPTYTNIQLATIYDPDTPEKILYYGQMLSRADYIVISTRRLYGTLRNLPKNYPITSNYYHLLFEGKLGYQKVAEFSSYPTFLGFKINDDASEETFQVFDHPKVIIFQNQKHFSEKEIEQLLQLQ